MGESGCRKMALTKDNLFCIYIQTEVGISDELKKKVIGYYEYLVRKTLKEVIVATIATRMTM